MVVYLDGNGPTGSPLCPPRSQATCFYVLRLRTALYGICYVLDYAHEAYLDSLCRDFIGEFHDFAI